MWTVHCALRSGRVTGYADRYAEVFLASTDVRYLKQMKCPV
jgi:hypothetical protein